MKITSLHIPAQTRTGMDFTDIVSKLDANGNNKIDVQRTFVVYYKDKAKKETVEYLLGRDKLPTGTLATQLLIRYENRGDDELGEYLRTICEGDTIFPSSIEKARQKIKSELGIEISTAEMNAIKQTYGKPSFMNPFVMVLDLKRLLLKKMDANFSEAITESGWKKAASLA